jgi:sensor histidine kinase regulating citrate/malate metabolism
LRKELEREKMMKIEAINKLAEIMNRRDVSKKESTRGNATVLRKKEKECKKLQQELSSVSLFSRNLCQE